MDAHYSEFRERLEEHKYRDHSGRHYINNKSFFAAHLTERHIQYYLKQIFSEEIPPVESERIVHAYRKQFSILLVIGQGRLIDTLVSDYDWHDGNLPHSHERLGEICRAANIDEQYAKEFYREQWQFLTDPLEKNMISRRDHNHILPFQYMRLINRKSGHALLWEVVVPEDLVGNSIRNMVPHARDKGQKAYRFALKQFMTNSKPAYEKEKKAFHALKNHGGIIKCLATWTQEIPSKRLSTEQRELMSISEEAYDSATTYNILLEYGERDLDVHFSKTNPPNLSSETTAFWTEMCNVLRTVREIHQWQPADSSNPFHGLHSDIKPDNLLWVFEHDGPRLKLADPGLFKYQKAVPERKKLHVDGGTVTYAAPERLHSPDRELKDPQLVDIWSLGCVFLIAASYVVGGITFVESFTLVRKKAFEQLKHPLWPRQSDFFHNCVDRVLPEVAEWYNVLREQTRWKDDTTRKVLDIIQNHMLQPMQTRLSAGELVQRFEEILERAPQDPAGRSELIKSALLEVDQGADRRSSDAIRAYKASGSGTANNSHGEPAADHQSDKDRARDASMRSTLFREATLRRAMSSRRDSHSLAMRPASSVGVHASRLEIVPEQFTQPLQQNHNSNHVLPAPGPGSSRASPSTYQPSMFQQPALLRHKANVRRQTLTEAFVELQEARDGRVKHPGKDPDLAKCFKNRDIILLIDNASSMQKHWADVRLFIDILVWKTRELDEDGMEVIFTTSDNSLKSIKYKKPGRFGSIRLRSSSKRVDLADELRQSEPTAESRGTQMARSLGNIFSNHLQKLSRERHRSPRQLTVMVLTDGLWQAMEGPKDKDAVKDQISDFADDVKNLVPAFKAALRPISVQFVHFSKNEDDAALEATERLERFDDDWPENDRQKRDIIDTQNITGNVYKMISGSLDPLMDGEDEAGRPGHSRNHSGSM